MVVIRCTQKLLKRIGSENISDALIHSLMPNYDEIFDWHIANRRPEVGVSDVADSVRQLAAGSRILDLGCGDGVPITRFLVQNGFEVFGVDSSAKMTERFRLNFPNAPIQCARIEDFDFFRTSFEAVIGWGVLFHLAREDQAGVISKVSQSLRRGGRFLFTSQKDEIAGESTMNGVVFPYISLGSAAYKKLLLGNELRLVDEHFDDWENYVYVAEKVLD